MTDKTTTHKEHDLNVFPVLALRDIVVFPHMIVPLFVGREKSVQALEDVTNKSKQILLATQKKSTDDDPTGSDIFDVGTLATVLQLLKLPDGTVKVLVEGTKRAKVKKFIEDKKFLEAEIEIQDEVVGPQAETDALSRAVLSQFEQYIKLNRKIPPEILSAVSDIEDPSKLADSIAAHIALKIPQKQALLENFVVLDRLEKIFSFIEGEISILQVEKRIRGRVKRQMEKTQREYYLNEQMKAIQKELGETEDGRDEISEFEKRLKKTKLSKEAKEKVEAELKKLRNMSPMSAEATVIRNYVEWILGIPWKKPSKLKHDLTAADNVLNQQHYGLEKVKERILEFLAVQQRVKKIKGPILCLVGPPGVGKTSLGKSIAEATGRSFVRVSLGGMKDEAEIRGHRRTYIGSMPGKIIQGMKKAKSSNPLFMLDEIDKLGADWRGDPSSALLEVLDPEQNVNFNDHYLEVDYDLSDVMFICTANTLRMPQPLMDRMEVIRISGYTEDEKLEICRRHLIPKQLEQNGLKESEWTIDEGALRDLIRYYTREAGVRNLEREIANLVRKAVKDIVHKKVRAVAVTADNLNDYAGVQKFRFGEIELEDMVGIVTGLAWTEVGGDVLTIEAVMLPGKGKMTSTGKLGDVMQESVQAAASYVRSQCIQFGIKPTLFEKKDIHVHVPEGATPKDGPSAGIAMVTAIVSVLTNNPIHKDIAMTGEITLRGRVLPIGGLKEKLLAAHRAGIKKVLIPLENEKDLAEIPEKVKKGLTVIPVANVKEVLAHALTKPLIPITWKDDEAGDVSAVISTKKPDDMDPILAH